MVVSSYMRATRINMPRCMEQQRCTARCRDMLARSPGAPQRSGSLTCRRARRAAAADAPRPGHQDGAGRVWLYPSEQMFFNAMQRKGWRPSEGDMRTVVSIHNAVNERAWAEARAPALCALCLHLLWPTQQDHAASVAMWPLPSTRQSADCCHAWEDPHAVYAGRPAAGTAPGPRVLAALNLPAALFNVMMGCSRSGWM